MKKFLLPFIYKSFSFSPKKPFQILCEWRVSRRELDPPFLQNSNWRRLVDDVRTYWQTSTDRFFIPNLSQEQAVLV